MAVSRYKQIGFFSIFVITAIVILFENNLIKFQNIWYGHKEENLDINENTKLILFWDTFHGSGEMNLRLGNAFKHCKVNNCITTKQRSLVPVEDFDAIVFHGARWNSWIDGVPEKRKTEQKYIFFSWESPYNTHIDENFNDDFYNWTMTYRRDSDIYFPYAIILKKATDYIMPNLNKIIHRSKLVAWMVSNCATPGTVRRREYVEELQKYIGVDVYGACGDLYCQEDCYEMFEQNYKFYLSFENSMCIDYATEKLYNVLQYDIVPIVLGFGDYSELAPPYSVINTNDFNTAKDLAEYLLMLNEDVGSYLMYFKWKTKYVIKDPKSYVLCQMCEKLNDPTDSKMSTYSDIRKWYFGLENIWCYE